MQKKLGGKRKGAGRPRKWASSADYMRVRIPRVRLEQFKAWLAGVIEHGQ